MIQLSKGSLANANSTQRGVSLTSFPPLAFSQPAAWCQWWTDKQRYCIPCASHTVTLSITVVQMKVTQKQKFVFF